MNIENQEYNNNEFPSRNMHDHCHKYMHHHVMLNSTDGSSFDGIIVNVDVNNVTVLIGEDVMEREDQQQGLNRQYGDYDGYGYGDNDDYGRPRRRRRYRRYRPRTFPLASLAALSLLPYFSPGYNPYYPPYYPYPGPGYPYY
ncbi:hypothetical protein [Aquibacillus rhizosphaerae]|uniref:DUF2642 domain-containing protein n=1 Tax=Aquibacillus rhizosphaerae TaxID=3051431 RepID=A0ABT7LAT0_9BACI|nr:hypothetical protein [Aquibacillus sp. LR5S19]MDL4842969.1 hypothetical protein [Aquibacillus sp. LR5S19]